MTSFCFVYRGEWKWAQTGLLCMLGNPGEGHSSRIGTARDFSAHVCQRTFGEFPIPIPQSHYAGYPNSQGCSGGLEWDALSFMAK